jgi:hypothetical protein
MSAQRGVRLSRAAGSLPLQNIQTLAGNAPAWGCLESGDVLRASSSPTSAVKCNWGEEEGEQSRGEARPTFHVPWRRTPCCGDSICGSDRVIQEGGTRSEQRAAREREWGWLCQQPPQARATRQGGATRTGKDRLGRVGCSLKPHLPIQRQLQRLVCALPYRLVLLLASAVASRASAVATLSA